MLAYSYIKTQKKAHCFDMPLEWIEVTCCRQGMPLIKEDLQDLSPQNPASRAVNELMVN